MKRSPIIELMYDRAMKSGPLEKIITFYSKVPAEVKVSQITSLITSKELMKIGKHSAKLPVASMKKLTKKQLAS